MGRGPHGAPPRQFVLLEGEQPAGWASVTFAPIPRAIPHVRHLTKYLETGAPIGQAFLFHDADGRHVATARSLSDFREVVARISVNVLSGHARRGDFSRWFVDVFHDEELGREVGKIESRWNRGELQDLPRALETLLVGRYWLARQLPL